MIFLFLPLGKDTKMGEEPGRTGKVNVIGVHCVTFPIKIYLKKNMSPLAGQMYS